MHSNFTNIYNILSPNHIYGDTYVTFMQLPHIREALHVGAVEFSPPDLVYSNLRWDFMHSAMHWTEKLLDAGIPIMYYR